MTPPEPPRYGRVVVLSDLHLSPDPVLSCYRAGNVLASVLARERTPGGVLVLAGDIVDFLDVVPRPASLDLRGSQAFVETTLDRLRRDPDLAAFFEAVGDWAREAGPVVVLAGNHDPEWLVPETVAPLRRAVGLDADDARLSVHQDAGP